MKGSARIIALCGVCGAISCVALLLTSLVPYAALIFGVMAAVATAIPMTVSGGGLRYSLLTYFATLVVGAVSGIFIGNIVAVAPVALFCVPFAIVKVWGESMRVTARVEHTETLESPFEGEQDAQVLKVEVNGKPNLNKVVKWVIYYILLETGLVLTFLLTWLLTPSVFERFYSSTVIFWLTIAIAQVAVPLYDLLLRGCLIAAVKVARKTFK